MVEEIDGAEWIAELAARLNARFLAEGALFRELEVTCAEGIESDWMSLEGEELLKGAEVIKYTEATASLGSGVEGGIV